MRGEWTVSMRYTLGLLLALLPISAWAMEIDYRHGHSFVFDLKYPPDYKHFDYVNPDAPQGGELRLATPGRYNTFNHFISRGQAATGLRILQNQPTPSIFYDQLLIVSADEPSARYGRLAEGVSWAEDYSWIAFKIREGARWHDGEPITVDDIIFTLDTLKEHGSATIKTNLRDVIDAKAIGPREVLFTNVEGSPNNRTVLEALGRMEILPKHYWEDRDPSRAFTVPPLGSGPYRIADYRMGRYVIYERDRNYWGNDLPFMRGTYNFDRIKYDYFRDQSVMRQALKSDVYDLLVETVSKSWELDYNFDGYHAGLFRKWAMPLSIPAGLNYPVIWNQRRERFQDPRVREALWLLYDFAFTNRVLLHNFYDRPMSFFHGSPMGQEGLPSEAELALLEPVRHLVPERVFTEEFRPQPGKGYGYNREAVKRALELFAEAGWVVENGRMINQETGRQFHIDFIVIAPALVRTLMPYIDSLQRIGIETTARAPEQSNFIYRMRQRQFDATTQSFSPGSLPGISLRHVFNSASADIDASLNWAGIKDSAVDHLVEQIIAAETEEELLAATRAFDRVMLWNFYFLPTMADVGVRHVFWDRFGFPEDAEDMQRRTFVETWWYDEARARRVDAGLASLRETETDD